jgi:predicted ArsR family transcriptional regulator
LTEVQERILAILDETGGVERGALADRLQMTSAQLEREIAALRHMEKVQGEKREGNRVFLVLWKG